MVRITRSNLHLFFVKKNKGKMPNYRGLPINKDKKVKKVNNGSGDVSNRDLMDYLVQLKASSEEASKQLDLYKDNNDIRVSKIERQTTTTNSKVNHLSKKYAKLEETTRTLVFANEKDKQHRLKQNITISGIEPTTEENLEVMVKEICNSFGVVLADEDIVDIYRIYSSKNSIIIVKLSNMAIKSSIMDKKRNVNIYSNDIWPNENNTDDSNFQIFINHHLTPYFGDLLMCGKREVKNGLIHSCWIGANGLLVRFSESERPYIFTSTSQLLSYVSANTQSNGNGSSSDVQGSGRSNRRFIHSKRNNATSSNSGNGKNTSNTNGNHDSKNEKRNAGNLSLNSSTDSSIEQQSKQQKTT